MVQDVVQFLKESTFLKEYDPQTPKMCSSSNSFVISESSTPENLRIFRLIWGSKREIIHFLPLAIFALQNEIKYDKKVDLDSVQDVEDMEWIVKVWCDPDSAWRHFSSLVRLSISSTERMGADEITNSDHDPKSVPGQLSSLLTFDEENSRELNLYYLKVHVQGRKYSTRMEQIGEKVCLCPVWFLNFLVPVSIRVWVIITKVNTCYKSLKGLRSWCEKLVSTFSKEEIKQLKAQFSNVLDLISIEMFMFPIFWMRSTLRLVECFWWGCFVLTWILGTKWSDVEAFLMISVPIVVFDVAEIQEWDTTTQPGTKREHGNEEGGREGSEEGRQKTRREWKGSRRVFFELLL